MSIVLGDVDTWTPEQPRKWDVIYHDIWNETGADNYEQMMALKKRYRPWLVKKGWISNWREVKCRYMYRRDKRDQAAMDARYAARSQRLQGHLATFQV